MLENLKIEIKQNVPKTWATDLLPFGGQLSRLHFRKCRNVLVDVPCDEIVAFFKVQKPGFRLVINNDAAPREHLIKISKELQEQAPHMVRCKADFKSFFFDVVQLTR
uniref:F-box/LRR-repeat protein n=1 Tax=Panagrellus redivivus TaxID=6233 RepID=A0A7E4V6N4_PANRE